MITHVTVETDARYRDDIGEVILVRLAGGTPVDVVEYGIEQRLGYRVDYFARIRVLEAQTLQNLEILQNRLACFSQEESLKHLAAQMGLVYNSLARAAREKRLLARQSGATWLTTERAIEYAIETGTLRPRKA